MGYKVINNLFKNAPNYAVINIFYIGLVINIAMFCFIMFEFKNVNIKPGLPGPKGEPGYKGPTGNPDTCLQCEPMRKNLGHRIVEHKKQSTLNVPIPQIPVNLPGRPI